MRAALGVTVFLLCCQPALAQLAPSVGYTLPVGGAAGETVEVTLGGYDWTPDVQLLVEDPRIMLELLDEPGPVIVPEPPYWFGKKARRAPFRLPREARARLTIPAEVPPGPVRWRVASANGAGTGGVLMVSPGRHLVEQHDREAPQPIDELPRTIHGQIRHIAEVDRYRFRAPASGLIRCRLLAPAVNSPLRAALQIHDAQGKLLHDAVDTAGADLLAVFSAQAGSEYTVSLYDVDFRGNRSFTYQLEIAAGPAVVAMLPAAGQAGAATNVTFIGYGVATGRPELEQTERKVTFPADTTRPHPYILQTKFGDAAPVNLPVSDLPQQAIDSKESAPVPLLQVPGALSGSFTERYGIRRVRFETVKGQAWSIVLRGARHDLPLDPVLAIADVEGKELARNDDLDKATTSAGLEWTAPADGVFEIQVSDASAASGSPAAVWWLEVRQALPDFELTFPEQVHVPSADKFDLALRLQRKQKFQGPVRIRFSGLPPGVTVPEEIIIPEKQAAAKIPFTAAADAAVTAALVHATAEAIDGDRKITHAYPPFCLAMTLKPPFSIDAEGKDDVTKWPRGTTFPAPVLIERDEGFEGDIVLEMASKQGRHRQGIRGPELTVPPGTSRILYPVFLPEWLETTRTSRMKVNGVARIKDPAGNLRWSLVTLKTRIGFLPTGAVFKLETPSPVLQVPEAGPVPVSLVLSRARELTEPAVLSLEVPPGLEEQITMAPATLGQRDRQATVSLQVQNREQLAGEITVTIRATAMRQGRYPAVTRVPVILNFGPGDMTTTSASR